MGYEIAGGLGVKMAAPDRDVYVLVGDGSYLMVNSELVTCVQEGIKIVVILMQNHGFQSIGALPRSVGGSAAWWHVPVAEVSELAAIQAARRNTSGTRRRSSTPLAPVEGK